MIFLKNKRLFFVLYLLFMSCLEEQGQADDCCKNYITCYGGYEGIELGTLGGDPIPFHFEGLCCKPTADVNDLLNQCRSLWPNYPTDSYYILPFYQGAVATCGQAFICDIESQKKGLTPQRKGTIPQIKNVTPQKKNATPQRKDVTPQRKDVTPQKKGVGSH
jgi:hypothetical protein